MQKFIITLLGLAGVGVAALFFLPNLGSMVSNEPSNSESTSHSGTAFEDDTSSLATPPLGDTHELIETVSFSRYDRGEELISQLLEIDPGTIDLAPGVRVTPGKVQLSPGQERQAEPPQSVNVEEQSVDYPDERPLLSQLLIESEYAMQGSLEDSTSRGYTIDAEAVHEMPLAKYSERRDPMYDYQKSEDFEGSYIIGKVTLDPTRLQSSPRGRLKVTALDLDKSITIPVFFVMKKEELQLAVGSGYPHHGYSKQFPGTDVYFDFLGAIEEGSSGIPRHSFTIPATSSDPITLLLVGRIYHVTE